MVGRSSEKDFNKNLIPGAGQVETCGFSRFRLREPGDLWWMFARFWGIWRFSPIPLARISSNANLLHKIDGTVGVLACLGATLLRKIGDALRSAPPPRDPQSLLFIKLAEQGSTVLAHEAIRRAVARVGAKNVYFLLFEENRFILDLLELIPRENVLTIRTKTPGEMVVSGLQRLAQVRRMRFDACVDMEFFARLTAVLAWATGAKARVGFHAFFGEGPYRGDLMTHRVIYNAHLHASQTFTSLVAALENDPAAFPTFGFVPPPGEPPPQFQPAPDEVDAMRRMLAGLMPAGARLVLLNANASDLLPLRRWDSANYLALAKRLLAEFPEVTIGFTGAPDEAGKVQALVDQVGSDRCFCLAGRTTLRQLLIVYGLAEVLVTNDSGPAHFATMTPIDVVALFGPETPLLFGAPSPRNHALWAGLACSPCVNALNNRQTACRNNLCMQSLSVDLVFDTVCRVYRQRKKI
jgi:ADP-heptose:LPS heptosyltransferase